MVTKNILEVLEPTKRTVYKTTNYDEFKRVPGNRPIKQSHVDELVYSISNHKNFLADRPILVDRNLYVLDGQHRLAAARVLMVEIYVIVSDNLSHQDIWMLNDKQLNWTLEDYQNTWVAYGKKEYANLKNFVEEHKKGISISDAIWLCHTRSPGSKVSHRELFTSGEYVINNMAFAKRVVGLTEKFEPYLGDNCRQRVFVSTIAAILSDVRYDEERMMAKLAMRGRALEDRTKGTEYIFQLRNLYNYKEQVANRVELGEKPRRSRSTSKDPVLKVHENFQQAAL